MRLEEHYLELYRGLRLRLTDRQAEVTLPELSQLLHCSERNVKLLLRRMRERLWIEWRAGLGRGHRSRLTFAVDPESMLAAETERLLAEGRFQEVMALTERGAFTDEGAARMDVLLREAFGYRLQPGSGTSAEGVLRFPAYRIPAALDPAYTTRRTELHLLRQLFDTLLVYDELSGRFRPGLAHEAERNEAGDRWVFYLQKHVRFHHGKPFTSRDAAFTLRRLTDPDAGSPYASLFAVVSGIECLDEHRLLVRLHAPAPYLGSLLASPAASIVPAELPADFASLSVGTGPFRLKRPNAGGLILEAFADYYLRPAHVDRVEMWRWQPIRSNDGAVRLEGDNEVGELNFRHYREREEAALGPRWREVERIDRGCKYVCLNLGKPGPLNDPAMRACIFRALRDPAFVRQLGGNRGDFADTFIGYEEANGQAPYSDTGKVTDAGTSTSMSTGTGTELTGRMQTEWIVGARQAEPAEQIEPATTVVRPDRPLRIVTYPGAGHERDAEWLEGRLVEFGIAAEVEQVEYERLLDEETLARADLFLLEQPVGEDAEWTLLTILANPGGPVRRCLPVSTEREVGERVTYALRHANRERRLRDLRAIETKLIEERFVVPWYRWRQTASFPQELEGVTINALGWADYRNVWFRAGLKDEAMSSAERITP